MQRRALRRHLPDCWRNFDIIHIHTPFAAHYEGVMAEPAPGVPAVETYHTRGIPGQVPSVASRKVRLRGTALLPRSAGSSPWWYRPG